MHAPMVPTEGGTPRAKPGGTLEYGTIAPTVRGPGTGLDGMAELGKATVC